MSEWQPIETAPKDGTQVLLACAGKWSCQGYFADYAEGWFEFNNHDTDSWGGPLYPTHWMPIPDAPK